MTHPHMQFYQLSTYALSLWFASVSVGTVCCVRTEFCCLSLARIAHCSAVHYLAMAADLIDSFYKALASRDGETMAACYHDDIVFEDPAFGQLKV